MPDAEETLMEHALAGYCSDNDCELHRIEVAIDEEVVRKTDVAFWLAGWDAAIAYMNKALNETVDEALGEGRRRTTLKPDHSVKVG